MLQTTPPEDFDIDAPRRPLREALRDLALSLAVAFGIAVVLSFVAAPALP